MQKKLSPFSRNIWLTAGLFALLAAAFSVYALSEKRIDRAEDLRHQSFLLADELRQSSDDLTRMVRTYVVTGDPRYKKYYQDILDIRNGKKPRPEGYENIYWDFVVASEPLPHSGSGQAIALLELMRQAGFTEQEFRKLEEAKANSDRLTAIEFEAMKLIEATGPEAEISRAGARMMMYDDKYYQAKVAIMKPINDFFALVDGRTAQAVQDAKALAALFRVVFCLFGLGLLGMLLWTNKFLHEIMGGSVDEVYQHITRIGRGDFSSAIRIPENMKESVLGQLAEMQTHLSEIDRERKKTEKEVRESEGKYRGLFLSSRDAIMILKPPLWKFEAGNPATIEMFRVKSEAEFLSFGPADLSPERQPDGSVSAGKAKEMIEAAALEGSSSFEWVHKRLNGEEFPAMVLLTRIGQGQEMILLANVRDITQQRQAEEEMKRKVAELERFNKIAIGRELKMIELKRKIKALEEGKATS